MNYIKQNKRITSMILIVVLMIVTLMCSTAFADNKIDPTISTEDLNEATPSNATEADPDEIVDFDDSISLYGTNNWGSEESTEIEEDFELPPRPTNPDDSEKIITINIKNTFTDTRLAQVQGVKIWDDSSDKYGFRPDEIVIHLYANGKDTGLTATASESTDWKYAFNHLEIYENGKEISYTVKEDSVPKYSVEYISE